MLVVENLCKTYNKTKVLDNVNFTLEKGEILSLVGESGAGKTTILRIINGLLKCDNGSIKIDSEWLCKNGVYCSLEELKNIRMNLGLVFQELNLFPHMTVIQNITEAPINVLKESKEVAFENARKILKSLSIENKENFYPSELSGGQKQRVAIARALSLKPKYICFDEPTSALDTKLTDEVSKIIKALSKEGIGIIIITHDIEFSKKISTKIIELSKGKIINEKNLK